MLRSGVTSTRPARSTRAPRAAPRGEAATPAAQTTVRANTRSSPMVTPSASTSVIARPKVTLTPNFSNCRSAAADSDSGERGQYSRSGFHEQHAGCSGIDTAELVPQGVAGDFRERPGEFHTGGTCAHDHEFKPCFALLPVLCGLGVFECAEHAGTDLERIIQSLQARRVHAPKHRAQNRREWRRRPIPGNHRDRQRQRRKPGAR